MLHEVFPRGHIRYERSRFARDLEDFGSWLQASGYSRDCLRGHLFRLRYSLERIPSVEPDSTFTVEQLQAIFAVECATTKRATLFQATRHAFQLFLSSRGRLMITVRVTPLDELCHRYLPVLSQQNGFSTETVNQHERTIRDFLNTILPAAQDLKCLTPTDIDRYLTRKSGSVGRGRLQHIIAHLRAFLRFCRMQGEISLSLDAIDAPRVYRDELPPRALAWAQVQALLHSIDRSSRSGWRDYTILYLMAHYGLRPCEIVSLRLDSIDWVVGTLKVEQRKTHSILVLPLIESTQSVLHQYLKHGRPDSPHPYLFLRARCPSGALTRHAVGDIFELRAHQGGLPKGYSAYSLRHAFAMRLLDRGVGLKAIGDLLGHRHLASTMQYLRLQIEMLRTAALPVPAQVQG